MLLNKKKTYLEFSDSLLTCGARTSDFDNVGSIDTFKISDVFGFSNLPVRAGAGELNLDTEFVLKIVEVLTAAANQGAMLSGGNFDSQDDTVAKSRYDLLQFRPKLGHELGLSTEADFI